MVVGSYLTNILTVGFRIPVYTSILYVSVIGALINLVAYGLVFHRLLRWGRRPVFISLVTFAFGFLLSELSSFLGYLYVEWRHAYPFPFLIKEYDVSFGQYHGVYVLSLVLTMTIYLITRIVLKQTDLEVRLNVLNTEIKDTNSDRLYALVWLISGGLACLAGGLYPLYFSIIPRYSVNLLFSVLAISLLGGMGNIIGGFYGCIAAFIEILLTGIGQNLFGAEIGELRLLINIIVILLVIMFRPKGITGEGI